MGNQVFGRLTAGALALTLLLTSGATGGVLFLCTMDGQLRSECCCGESEAEPERDGPEVERPACCETRVSEVNHLAATFNELERPSPVQPVLAVSNVASPLVSPMPPEACASLGARGPPSAQGPPLYIQNCRYLI